MNGSTVLQTFTLTQLMSYIDGLMNNFVENGYEHLAAYLSPMLITLSGIFIALLGYGIMYGRIRMSAGTFAVAVVKIIAVNYLIANWGVFDRYIVHFVYGLNDGLGSAILNAGLPINMPQSTGGINEALNNALILFLKMGKLFWESAGWQRLGFYFVSLFLFAMGGIMVAIAFFEIMLSKVMLAILFILTPVILPFAYFRPGSKVVENWASMIIAMVFLQLFVMICIAFSLCLLTWLTEGLVFAKVSEIPWWGVLMIGLVSLVNILLLKKAAAFAYGIAYGFGGNGAVVSGGEAVSGMARFAFGGLGAAAAGVGGMARAGASRMTARRRTRSKESGSKESAGRDRTENWWRRS